MVKIVCGCKQLVEVVDSKVVEHTGSDGDRCLTSGMRHIGHKFKSGAGGPSFELLAVGPVNCPSCGDHSVLSALVRVTSPDPSNN